MKRYGLIGKTLRHSWSQQWFSRMFAREGITNAEYTLYELPSVDGLKQWMLQKGINGLNVTIPYKEAVLPLLDRLDSEAQSIGAVNCIKVVDGQLEGYNTDAPAFAHTLQPLLQSWHSRALVLGTGGASKAVTHALHGLGIDCTLVSRHPELHPGAVSYSQAESLAETIAFSGPNPDDERMFARNAADYVRRIRAHACLHAVPKPLVDWTCCIARRP